MQYITTALVFIFFLTSCSNNSKNDLAVFRAMSISFEVSNNTLSSSNTIIYKTLDNRLTEPKTAAYAEVWQPKAVTVSNLIMPVIKFIDTIRSDLKHKAGLNDSNLESVKEIFIQKNRGIELYNKLKKLITEINILEEAKILQFENYTKHVFNYLDSGKNAATDFTKTFFDNGSVIRAISLLEKIKNDILNAENNILIYYYHKTAPIDHGYKVFSAIVGQSSNYVKAGDKIMITAGIGAYSVESKPKVTIDRKDIELNPDGVAVYEFKTPVKGGKYFKGVKIEYTEPDGNKKTRTFNIDYTVINPNQNPQ